MVNRLKACLSGVAGPGSQAVVTGVSVAIPSLLVSSPRIGAEQHSPGLEACMQFRKNSGQVFAGHVEERGVREHAVEVTVGQLEVEEILVPHFALGVGSGH